MSSIKIQKADITTLNTDAIVNAANPQLSYGGGVCGAIFRAAGVSKMTEACEAIGGCRTGNAVITPGFELPAKYVIHAVGPMWHGGNSNEDQMLYGAYFHALAVARQYNCHSVAFPLISAGIYGFPVELAWVAGLRACRDFIKANADFDMHVFFAVLDDDIKASGDAAKLVMDQMDSQVMLQGLVASDRRDKDEGEKE